MVAAGGCQAPFRYLIRANQIGHTQLASTHQDRIYAIFALGSKGYPWKHSTTANKKISVLHSVGDDPCKLNLTEGPNYFSKQINLLFIYIMKPKIDNSTIFTAALSVFARFGFKKTTVQDIADQLGMTKGNLYRYAQNKRDLYEKTVSWALVRWQDNVRRSIARQTRVEEQFRVMCRSAVTYLSSDPDLRQVLAADPDIFPMFAGRDPYGDINQASVEMIKAILKRGIQGSRFRPVDVDITAETIFGIYKMLIIRAYIRNEEQRLEQMFEQALELMTHGLLEPEGH